MKNLLFGALFGILLAFAFLLGRECAPEREGGPLIIRDTVKVKEIITDTVVRVLERVERPVYIVESPETLRLDTLWQTRGDTSPLLLFAVSREGERLSAGGVRIWPDTTGYDGLAQAWEWRVPRGADWRLITAGDSLTLIWSQRPRVWPYFGALGELGPGGWSLSPLVGVGLGYGGWELRGEAFWLGVRVEVTKR